MPSRPLSFDRSAHIGLIATPSRLLAERADDETVIAELLSIATEWSKRTKREVARFGPGTPTIRTDLISAALGWTLRALRDEVARDGVDLHRYGERARLLRLTGERAGGLDEDLVRLHEWAER